MSTNTQVGFNQRVRLEWLEETAELVLMGRDSGQVKAALDTFLRDKVSVASETGSTRGSTNREKIITILMKIWVNPPTTLQGLHQEGLELLRELPSPEHLALHWGMSMAVYPFFGLVAESAGRLLTLNNYINISQLQRRMRELLGEKESVERAAARVMRCFVDWRVLEDSEKKGFYRLSSTCAVTDSRLVFWLIEAALISSGSTTGMLASLVQSPALFPFQFSEFIPAQVENNKRLELFYQGYNQNIVALRA